MRWGSENASHCKYKNAALIPQRNSVDSNTIAMIGFEVFKNKPLCVSLPLHTGSLLYRLIYKIYASYNNSELSQFSLMSFSFFAVLFASAISLLFPADFACVPSLSLRSRPSLIRKHNIFSIVKRYRKFQCNFHIATLFLPNKTIVKTCFANERPFSFLIKCCSTFFPLFSDFPPSRMLQNIKKN